MIFQICILFVAFSLGVNSQQNGHYRCHWHPGPAQGRVLDVSGNHGDPAPVDGQAPECSMEGSESLGRLVGRCTGQPLPETTAAAGLCRDNGTWDCPTFFGVCKTLIRTETTPRPPAIDPRESLADTCKRLFAADLSAHQPNQAARYPAAPGGPGCERDANSFTLKDLSLAVLVSFITGATMLAVVIAVVWKCRNTKWESEQRKLTTLQKVQSLATLQHILAMTNVRGGGSRREAESGHFSNPGYARAASSALIEDILAGQDRMYEEIASWRESSLKRTDDDVYAAVDKAARRGSSRRRGPEGGVRAGGADTDEEEGGQEGGEKGGAPGAGSVTDSGYLEEVVGPDRKTDGAGEKDRPMFSIDMGDDGETSVQ